MNIDREVPLTVAVEEVQRMLAGLQESASDMALGNLLVQHITPTLKVAAEKAGRLCVRIGCDLCEALCVRSWRGLNQSNSSVE